jgi:hypothetical protein
MFQESEIVCKVIWNLWFPLTGFFCPKKKEKTQHFPSNDYNLVAKRENSSYSSYFWNKHWYLWRWQKVSSRKNCHIIWKICPYSIPLAGHRYLWAVNVWTLDMLAPWRNFSNENRAKTLLDRDMYFEVIGRWERSSSPANSFSHVHWRTVACSYFNAWGNERNTLHTAHNMIIQTSSVVSIHYAQGSHIYEGSSRAHAIFQCTRFER